MIEFLMVTFFARTRRPQLIVLLSMVTFAVWIVQGPVYAVSTVPAGTPVLVESGNVRPSTLMPPPWVAVGVTVGVMVGVGVGVTVGVRVGVGEGVGPAVVRSNVKSTQYWLLRHVLV